MDYRSNKKSDLTNNFADSPPTVDDLEQVWPTDAEPIDDPTKWDEDQKALVPADRVIRAATFNAMSDSMSAIEHFLSENAGKVWLIESSGITACSNVASLRLGYQAAGSAVVSGTTVTAAMDTATAAITWDGLDVDEVSFEKEVDIPASFGSTPWDNETFHVHVTPSLATNVRGIWSGTNDVTLARDLFNRTPYIFTSVCPSDASDTKARIVGKACFMGTLGDAGVVSWTFPQDYVGNTLNNNPDAPIKGYTYKVDPSDNFRAFKDDTYINNWARPLTGVTGRVAVWPCIDWASFRVVNANAPYFDTARLGANGGILYHKSFVPRQEDVFIEFAWHGWGKHSFFQEYVAGGFPCKSGVFLRLSKVPSINAAGSGKDYTAVPQFSGYLLRLGAAEAADNSDATLNDAVAEWAIMKVENEQFASHYGDIKYFWDRGHTISTLPTAGTEYTPTTGGAEGSCPPGTWSVLAFGTEPLVPNINHATKAEAGTKYIYRFEIEGATLRLKKRATTTETWTTVLSVTDPSPLEIDPVNDYYPAGVYCKGMWGDSGHTTNSGNDGAESHLYLSNIRTGVLMNSITGTTTVNLRMLFFAGLSTISS